MPLPYIPRAISRPFRITTSAVNPRAAAIAIWMPALALTVASAIYAKEAGSLPPLLGLSSSAEASDGPSTPPHRDPLMTRPGDTRSDASVFPSGTRWFDGRHVRPARVIIMRVTAYSPDARSCGKFADGQTATLNSVWTNAMRLVAADTDVLPFWSLVSVPGYAEGEVVPVLDRGAAIKGAELDVLFPTHEMARRWGVRSVPVTVWEYVDAEQP